MAALAVSPDDKYVVSGDRDNKVRVSVLPASPLEVRMPTSVLHQRLVWLPKGIAFRRCSPIVRSVLRKPGHQGCHYATVPCVCVPEDVACVLQGAHEIESYCLGHKSFVTAVVFVEGVNDHVALASAGGDGSVRWPALLGPRLPCSALVTPLNDASLQHITTQHAFSKDKHRTSRNATN